MKTNHEIKKRHTETLHHLNRIQGQIEALKKIIEDDSSCFDIAQLTTSVAKSFDSLRAKTLEGFILNHLLEGKELPPRKMEALQKIINLYKK